MLKKPLILLIMFLFIFIFTGCTSKPDNIVVDNTSTSNQIKNEKVNEQEKEVTSEISETWYILGNNTRLREKETIDSEILDTLSIGTKVEIISKSPNQEAIGSYQDYWYKVSINDKIGWCFGEFISSEHMLKEKLQERLTHYFSVDKLTISESLQTVTAYMNMSNDTTLIDRGAKEIFKLQEKQLGDYERLLYQTGISWDYSVGKLNQPEKIEDQKIKEVITKIKNNGYSIYMEEGDFYLEPDPQFILSNLIQGLSNPYIAFLELELMEVEDHALSDGAIIIPWDELADRIANWDYYINKYPDSEESQFARKNYYKPYLHFYFVGLDNTPTYQYETNILDNQVKNSYERFMEQYPDTEAYKKVKDVYERLEKNEFIYNDELKQYLDALYPW